MESRHKLLQRKAAALEIGMVPDAHHRTPSCAHHIPP